MTLAHEYIYGMKITYWNCLFKESLYNFSMVSYNTVSFLILPLDSTYQKEGQAHL